MYIMGDITGLYQGTRPKNRKWVTEVFTYFQNRGLAHHLPAEYPRSVYVDDLFIRPAEAKEGNDDEVDEENNDEVQENNKDKYDYQRTYGNFKYGSTVKEKLDHYR